MLWLIAGGILFLALLAGVGIMLVRGLQPTYEYYAWIRDAPDPAFFKCSSHLIFQSDSDRFDAWNFTRSDENVWFVYSDDEGYHVSHAGMPLDNVDERDWRPLPVLAAAHSYAAPGFLVCDARVMLMYRDFDKKQNFLSYMDVGQINQWHSVLLPQELSLCRDLQAGPADEIVYFICRDKQLKINYLVCVSLDQLDNPDSWTRVPLPVSKPSDMDLEIVNDSAAIASSSKQGLYYCFCELGLDGQPGEWSSHQIGKSLQGGKVDLSMVGSKPVISHYAIHTNTLSYIRSEVEEPQRSSDWVISTAYKGLAFGWSTQLGAWQGRPVMFVVDGFGGMLLLAKNAAPQSPQDWYIGKFHESWPDEALYIRDAASPAFIWPDNNGAVYLLTYNSQPMPVVHGRRIYQRLDALRRVLPID